MTYISPFFLFCSRLNRVPYIRLAFSVSFNTFINQFVSITEQWIAHSPVKRDIRVMENTCLCVCVFESGANFANIREFIIDFFVWKERGRYRETEREKLVCICLKTSSQCRAKLLFNSLYC